VAHWNRPREYAQMIEIARLYFDQRLTQKDIAERLGIPQTTISRLLQRASEEGIVKHVISPPLLLGLQADVLKKSRSKGIRDVRVVPAAGLGDTDDKNIQNLGAQGAEYLWEVLSQHEGEEVTISMACGDTLGALARQFVSYLQQDPSALGELKKKTIWLYPLNLFWEPELESTIYPPALVVTLGTQLIALDCKVHAFAPQPPLHFYREFDTMDKEQRKRQIEKYDVYLDKAKKADIFLLGIGAFRNDDKYKRVLNELDNKQSFEEAMVAGEVNYQPFTHDGKFVPLRKLLAVTGEELSEIAAKTTKKVIAVAGGRKGNKTAAILASLKCNPPYNVLITDEVMAEQILDAPL